MIETSIQFDKAGLDEFAHQLRRLAEVCGYEREKAVRMATVALLKSLRASTKKSKTVREVKSMPTARRRMRKAGMMQFPFVMTRYDRRTDAEKRSIIFAASLSEAKASPFARIRYSGLARQSWNWAQRDLFSNEESTDSAPFRRPRNAVEASKSGADDDFCIRITNRLEYILSAFTVSGQKSVSDAAEKASNSMRKHVERWLERDLARAAK